MFGPRELRHLGRGVLEHLAPEIADEAEYQRLLAEETRAQAATRLSLRPRGDGSTDLHARVRPVANRLRTYLDAYTSPRRTPLGEVDAAAGRPPPQGGVRGVPGEPARHRLPVHGGTTTSVMVTLDLDTLLTGLGTATTSTGDRITAEQARRLACQARIIPVVLGRKGEVLDLGRSARLFSPAQRKALAIRDRECTAEGCAIPAAWCEAHHGSSPGPKAGVPTSPTASWVHDVPPANVRWIASAGA